MPTPERTLREMHPRDAVLTDYVAREPAATTDLFVPFVDFMWQRATWSGVRGPFDATRQDFHDLATSVAKIDHFFACKTDLGIGSAFFVATELDYVFIQARRTFNHVHEVIARIWHQHVRLVDEALERRRKGTTLPDSFRGLVFEKGKPCSSERITERFVLPPAYASACAQVFPFFESILSTRDEIMHGLDQRARIFRTNCGWCVDPTERPFSKFNVWTEAHRYNRKLVSLRPLLAHVVLGTITSCSVLLDAFAKQVVFPEPMAPGFHVFIRGPHNAALASLLAVADGASPWWGEERPPQTPTGP
jgi:hypothetical protein